MTDPEPLYPRTPSSPDPGQPLSPRSPIAPSPGPGEPLRPPFGSAPHQPGTAPGPNPGAPLYPRAPGAPEPGAPLYPHPPSYPAPGAPLYPPAPDGGWGPAGPPPVAPVFPFAEARAALQALDALADDIGQFGFQHRLLTSSLDGSFFGTARSDFDDQLATAQGQLDPEATALLDSDRTWLLQAIAEAEAREDQYAVDLATWRLRRQHAASDAAVPA